MNGNERKGFYEHGTMQAGRRMIIEDLNDKQTVIGQNDVFVSPKRVKIEIQLFMGWTALTILIIIISLGFSFGRFVDCF